MYTINSAIRLLTRSGVRKLGLFDALGSGVERRVRDARDGWFENE